MRDEPLCHNIYRQRQEELSTAAQAGRGRPTRAFGLSRRRELAGVDGDSLTGNREIFRVDHLSSGIERIRP